MAGNESRSDVDCLLDNIVKDIEMVKKRMKAQLAPDGQMLQPAETYPSNEQFGSFCDSYGGASAASKSSQAFEDFRQYILTEYEKYKKENDQPRGTAEHVDRKPPVQ